MNCYTLHIEEVDKIRNQVKNGDCHFCGHCHYRKFSQSARRYGETQGKEEEVRGLRELTRKEVEGDYFHIKTLRFHATFF